MIADNKLAQLSSWDANLLRSEMEILIKEDFEIETTGFSTAEIDLMFDPPASGPEDDADELQPDDIPLTVVSRLGDLWRLGNHRLLCANALEGGAYQQIMQGESAQMGITDPPYNVPIDGHVCGSGKVKHKEFAMASGEMTAEQFTRFLGQAFGHMHGSSQDGAMNFIFMDWRHTREILDAAAPVFGEPRQLYWAERHVNHGGPRD